MLYIIIYVVAFLIFLCAPWPLQIIFLLANIFIPDPIPIVDEALMTASILKKIAGAGRIMDFAERHPTLFKLIIVGIIIAAIVCIKIFIFS